MLDSLLVEAADDEVSEVDEILLLKPESLDLALVVLALSFSNVHVSSSLEIAEDTSAASTASEIVEAPVEAPCEGSLVETAAVAVAFATLVAAAVAPEAGGEEEGSCFILVEAEGTVSCVGTAAMKNTM